MCSLVIVSAKTRFIFLFCPSSGCRRNYSHTDSNAVIKVSFLFCLSFFRRNTFNSQLLSVFTFVEIKK